MLYNDHIKAFPALSACPVPGASQAELDSARALPRAGGVKELPDTDTTLYRLFGLGQASREGPHSKDAPLWTPKGGIL